MTLLKSDVADNDEAREVAIVSIIIPNISISSVFSTILGIGAGGGAAASSSESESGDDDEEEKDDALRLRRGAGFWAGAVWSGGGALRVRRLGGIAEFSSPCLGLEGPAVRNFFLGREGEGDGSSEGFRFASFSLTLNTVTSSDWIGCSISALTAIASGSTITPDPGTEKSDSSIAAGNLASHVIGDSRGSGGDGVVQGRFEVE